MAPERLKPAFGNRIVFHGGLDTQEVLPSDHLKTIEAAVRHLLEVMQPWTDGGYVFAPAHNLQRDVSARAVVGMHRSAHSVLSRHARL